MAPDILRSLAEDISRQIVLNNWLFYVIFGSLTLVVSALGAYLSTYMSRKAERLASRRGFEQVLEQLKQSTALTESIRADVHSLAARTEKLRWLKSEKLEEYLVETLRSADFMSKDMQHRFFDSPASSDEDPFMRASMLQTLYLPELENAHSTFLKAIGHFRSWIATGMQDRIDAMKLGKGKIPPSEAHLAKFPDCLQGLNAAVTLIEQDSKKLARQLHEA